MSCYLKPVAESQATIKPWRTRDTTPVVAIRIALAGCAVDHLLEQLRAEDEHLNGTVEGRGPAIAVIMKERHRIVTEVGVWVGHPTRPGARELPEKLSGSPPTEFFQALWDTGAEMTVVTPAVVQAGQLKCHRFGTIRGISEDGMDVRYHLATLVLKGIFLVQDEADGENKLAASPAMTLVRDVEVAMLPKDGILGDIDILIGMDVIEPGDFAISHDADGHAIFSFRTPSRRQPISFL